MGPGGIGCDWPEVGGAKPGGGRGSGVIPRRICSLIMFCSISSNEQIRIWLGFGNGYRPNGPPKRSPAADAAGTGVDDPMTDDDDCSGTETGGTVWRGVSGLLGIVHTLGSSCSRASGSVSLSSSKLSIPTEEKFMSRSESAPESPSPPSRWSIRTRSSCKFSQSSSRACPNVSSLSASYSSSESEPRPPLPAPPPSTPRLRPALPPPPSSSSPGRDASKPKNESDIFATFVSPTCQPQTVVRQSAAPRRRYLTTTQRSVTCRSQVDDVVDVGGRQESIREHLLPPHSVRRPARDNTWQQQHRVHPGALQRPYHRRIDPLWLQVPEASDKQRGCCCCCCSRHTAPHRTAFRGLPPPGGERYTHSAAVTGSMARCWETSAVSVTIPMRLLFAGL